MTAKNVEQDWRSKACGGPSRTWAKPLPSVRMALGGGYGEEEHLKLVENLLCAWHILHTLHKCYYPVTPHSYHGGTHHREGNHGFL